MSKQIMSTQTQQAGTVVYTYLPQSTGSAGYVTQSQSLSTGWIVAIVSLVLLAVMSTYTYWNWRKSCNAGRYRQASNQFGQQEFELLRPRAARLRDSMSASRLSRFV